MPKKSLKKNAILNMIRVLATVVFPLITFPYATRILGAENLGKVQFSASVIVYFSLIAELGISSYGVREGSALRNNKSKFEKFANEIFTINLLSTLISYILLGITLLLPTKLSDYSWLIFIQSITIVFTTLGVDWLYGAKEDYLFIAIKGILTQVASLLLLFLFVKQSTDYHVYAIITVIASSGANLLNFIHAKKYCNLRPTKHLNLKKHLPSLLILFANVLAINIYVSSDMVMLGLTTTEYATGIYSVAVKIYSVVRSLINAVTAVTIPRLALLLAQNQKTAYFNLSASILNNCIALVLPAITGLFMLSPEVIRIVGGEGYLEGTTALRLLSGALAFAVLSNFFANAILVVNKKEKYVLKATVVAGILNVVLNLFLIPSMAQNGAALTTLISEVVVTLICLYYGRTNFSKNGFIKNLAQSIFGCVVLALIIHLIKSLHLSHFLSILLSFLIGALAYFLVMLALKNQSVLNLTKGLKAKTINKGQGQ